MILGVMTLRQWIDAYKLRASDTNEWLPEAIKISVTALEDTNTSMLLLCSDPGLIAEFNQQMEQFSEWIDPRCPIIVRETLGDTEAAYIQTIRDTHRSEIAPDRVVSFISTVQQIDEFTHLSYRNPGLAFQHYHHWVNANLPIYPVKHKLVMFAGEIIKQDRKKFIPLLIPIAQQQLPVMDLTALITKVTQCIALEEAQGGVIYRFKMGFLEEGQFDALMIQSLAQHTGITLSVEQFNQLWQATNPDFAQIATYLQHINVSALRQAGYELELISYTNFKDMSHLTQELQQHDQDYVLVNGHLMGFAGMALSPSFIEQKSAKEMLQDSLRSESGAQSRQFSSSLNRDHGKSLYLITSSNRKPTELETLEHPQFHVLLGWDGSSLHTWVEHQLTTTSNLELTAK